MNKQFKMMPLALAIAGLCVAGSTMANENGHGGGHHGGHHGKDKEGVSISKELKVEKDVEYEGEVDVDGLIYVDSLGMAVIDDSQFSLGNEGNNKVLDNNATVGGNTLRNGSGNIGVNVGAGDNNVQGNSAALAATDAAFVFGSGDAEIFLEQAAAGNMTTNLGVTNDASLGSNALRNAKGNIGVNVAAGNSNVQKNAFAASTTSGVMSEATVQVSQTAMENSTSNMPVDQVITTETYMTLDGGMDGGYVGVGAGVYEGTERGGIRFRESGGIGGTYSGTSDQIGNVYPDIWGNDPGDDPTTVHPTDNAGPIAHMDLDTATQGGTDLNGDGGALAFNESGTIEGGYTGGGRGGYRGSEEGELGFVELGLQSLSGEFSGTVTHNQHVYIRPANNATLDGNALRNAAGNISVNVAAGSNNLQNNSLAISHLDSVMPGETNGE